MRIRFWAAALSVMCVTGVLAGLVGLRAAGVITLTRLPDTYPGPVGIDWLSTSNQLLISTYYDSGTPHNFETVDRGTGAHVQWGTVSGWQNEIYFATVRPSQPGGWVEGDVFSAKGFVDLTHIAQFDKNGTLINPSFATLPGENKLKRGGLTFDRYDVPGLHGALLVLASNQSNVEGGGATLWKVDVSGNAHKIINLPDHNGHPEHGEGIAVIPNDPAYGTLAGKILVGREEASEIAVIDPVSETATVSPISVHIEDIWVIPANADFYAVDYDGSNLWTTPASQWASAGLVGKVLFVQESPASLYVGSWNGSSFDVVNLNVEGAQSFEHITFVPVPPGLTIKKYTNGVDANDPNASGVPNIAPGGTVTWTYEVKNTGSTSVPRAQVSVTDNTTGVTPTFTSETSGNGDTIFDPGEVWLYTATGTALDLTLPAPTGVHTVANSCTAGGTQPPRTAYTNVGTATIPGASATDPSSYCNPPVPNITIVKLTNGQDANDPNAPGVPNIPAGGTVTWTYQVTNTGQTSVPRAQVTVTDNTTGVTPTFTSEQSGNGDTIFNPGEVWLYTATGTALNLTLPPPAGVHTVANSCTAGGSQPPRTAYTNIGTVTIPGASATDPSSYCNPPPPPNPNVTIVKYTNGADANDPNAAGVPNIPIGGTVTWTYKVTNTGATSVPKAQVSVTDNTTGVTPTFDSELTGNGDAIFNPGEVWLYKATGTALNLTLPPPSGVHTVANSCTAGGTQTPRTAYTNVGTATIPGASASDPSSYCNPPVTPCPAGTFSFFFDAGGNLNIVYDQFPAPNDNSYGVNAVGWGGHGHSFKDLTNSDHAGFQLVNPSGVVKLDFAIDYITLKAGTPSGYGSLGATGGDGKVNVAADGQGATGITGDSSLARNLNNLGYFVGRTEVPATKTATNGTDLLIDSPKTVNTTDNYTLVTPNPWVNGWDFHDTYYVTISAARLASLGFDAATWKVQPNADELHNSPAKACPASTGGGSCNLTETTNKVDKKEVQITIMNGASTDVFLTALNLTWPAANGKLMQIKLDGDVVYDNPDIAPPSANLTTAQLVADQNKRKLQHGSSDVLHLIFEKNADTDLSHYAGTLTFGDCSITILP